MQIELFAQNLVLNPSFEENKFVCDSNITYGPMSSDILDWRIFGDEGNYGYYCKYNIYANPPKTGNGGYQHPRTLACGWM
ncbi:MAG: hypothetical protein EOP53_03990 [Sphingobacteriales bacterium]|nr:MAG: hypothetical protein EOP53_03990 [Sphingobacteriales bacterium]